MPSPLRGSRPVPYPGPASRADLCSQPALWGALAAARRSRMSKLMLAICQHSLAAVGVPVYGCSSRRRRGTGARTGGVEGKVLAAAAPFTFAARLVLDLHSSPSSPRLSTRSPSLPSSRRRRLGSAAARILNRCSPLWRLEPPSRMLKLAARFRRLHRPLQQSHALPAARTVPCRNLA